MTVVHAVLLRYTLRPCYVSVRVWVGLGLRLGGVETYPERCVRNCNGHRWLHPM